jgi:hypothetical protein
MPRPVDDAGTKHMLLFPVAAPHFPNKTRKAQSTPIPEYLSFAGLQTWDPARSHKNLGPNGPKPSAQLTPSDIIEFRSQPNEAIAYF